MEEKEDHSKLIDIQTFKIGANFTESPVNKNTITPVTLCSRTPKNLGFSPGALVSVSIFSEST